VLEEGGKTSIHDLIKRNSLHLFKCPTTKSRQLSKTKDLKDDVSLLLCVSDSGLGCTIKRYCMSIFMYMDDIILVAPSVSALQRLLHVCENQLKWLDTDRRLQVVNLSRINTSHRHPRSNFVTEAHWGLSGSVKPGAACFVCASCKCGGSVLIFKHEENTDVCLKQHERTMPQCHSSVEHRM